MPVFAFSPELPQGAARLVGPTGGYLMAYPFAAFVTGMLATRGFDRRYLTSVLAMAAGLAVIFAGGVTWLTLFAPGADGRSLERRAGHRVLPVRHRRCDQAVPGRDRDAGCVAVSPQRVNALH